MRSAKEAVAYLKALHSLVRYLEICDGNMQEGSFRCDANVSIRRKGDTKFGTRTELKNINSFRFVERAINYEIERQIALIEGGGKVNKKHACMTPTKMKHAQCVAKKKRMIIVTFPILICYLL